MLQTLKVTSASLWRDVHEIKFPLPPGGHVDVSNEFIIPLTMRVLKKTVQTCAHPLSQSLSVHHQECL